MLIYLDTSLWNKLCDQKVDAKGLVSALTERDAQLVLGTNAVYELAKTFQMKAGAHQRGQQLFSHLTEYVRLGIPFLRETRDILGEETKHATGETRSVQ